MNHHTAEEKQLCQYLLGKLAEDVQRRLEEKLMTQANLLEQLEVLEDELIDEYLRNALSDKDRESFEEHFLSSPERHQKLRFAQAFRSYVAVANEGKEKEPSRSSLWQTLWATLRAQSPALSYGLPVAILGAFLGCLWMAGTIQRLQTEVAQVRTEQGSFQEREQQLQQQLEEQRERGQVLEQQLAQAQAQQRPAVESRLSSILTFALTAGSVRDTGTSNRVTIPSGTMLVKLEFELGDNRYQDYRAVLESNGSEILVFNKLKAERRGASHFVVLPVPAYVLPHEDYSLKLSGLSSAGEFDPLGNYTFRVLPR